MNASSKKKLSQYERLAGTLRDRIAAGIYARGDKLPSEMELMDESGLSRSTVRHALKALVDEGLVRTERGRGAFVADTPALHENNLVFSSYTKQVEGQGMKPTTRTVDSGFAKAAGSIAKFFDAAVGSKLVKLVRLRYLDDAPLCLETTYLPQASRRSSIAILTVHSTPRCDRSSIARRHRGIRPLRCATPRKTRRFCSTLSAGRR